MTIKKWLTALFLAYLPAVALAVEYRFTLGLQGGYRGTEANFKDTDFNLNEADEDSFRLDSPLLAAYFNFDITLNRWVIGLGLDYTHHEDSLSYSPELDDVLSEERTLTFFNRKDVSLIIGYYLQENLRAYIRGGWGINEYGYTDQDTEFNLSLKGPLYGVGVAYDLDENIELRLDYRLSRYSDERSEGSVTTDYKVYVTTLLVGVGYRF